MKRRAIATKAVRIGSSLLGVCLLAGVLSSPVLANPVDWVVDASGYWDVAANWSSSPSLPGLLDDVTIDRALGAFIITHRTGTTSINSLVCTEGLVLSGGSLSVANNSTISGALDISGGTLGGAGNVAVGGLITWTGGEMQNAGVVNANGGMTISGSGIKRLVQRTLNNAGTTTWSGTGSLYLNQGGVINNLSGALWDIQGDCYSASNGGGGTFNNAGTLRKSAGSGTASIGDGGSWTFKNTGTVQVQSGTLSLPSGGTHTGTFNVSSGATLQFGGTHTLNAGATVSGDGSVVFSSGTVILNDAYSVSGNTTFSGSTVTFNGAVSNLPANLVVSGGSVNFNGNPSLAFDTVTASGGVGGSANITVSGLYTWTDGWYPNQTIGSGTTYANGGMNISGSTSKAWSRHIVSAGTTTWTGTGQVAAWNGMVFDNLSGAIFDVQNDVLYWDYHGGAIFNNGGTFKKSAGTGTTSMGARFNNTGTVQVQTGTLSLSGGGTSTGTFNVSNGATLTFTSGTHTLNAGATVSGGGNVAFSSGAATLNDAYNITGTTTFGSGGTVTFNTPYDAGHGTTFSGGTVNFNFPVSNLPSALVVSGGSVNFNGNPSLAFDTVTANGGVGGTADITASGLITWTGGSMSGTGTTYANGGMSLSGSGSKDLYRRIDNAGILTLTGTGTVWSWSGAVINNLAGATFDIQSDVTLHSSGGGPVNNAGTLKKSAGSGTTSVYMPVNNTGAVEVQSGTLALYGGTSNGPFSVSPGASLMFGWHTLNAGATVSGAGNVVFNGGTVTLNDAYSITGTTTFSSGTATFNTPYDAVHGTTFSGGKVNFNFPVSNLPSALVVTGGGVNFNGNPSLTFNTITTSGGVGGTANITASGLITWTDGSMSGTGTTYANGGMTISGSGTKDLYRRIDNAGTLTWTGSGTVYGYSGSVINNLAGATFDVQSDVPLNRIGGGPVNNAGTFKKSAGNGTTWVGMPLNNTGTVEVQTGTLALYGGGTSSGPFSVSPGATLEFGGSHIFGAGATVSGSGNVNFSGGTVTLNDAYNITGTTTVSSGTLQIGNGGTLGGTGTIIGATAINAGGILAPGASPGTLKVGTFSMAANSTYEWELGAAAADKVVVTGSLTLNPGWKLSLASYGGAKPAGGVEYDLFTYTGTFTVGSTILADIIAIPVSWPNVTIGQDPTAGAGRVYLKFGTPGDTNDDGVVDAADFVTLKKNFNTSTGLGEAAGDFDATGTVNWADLNILTGNIGSGSGAPGTAPEPATLGLLAIGALAMLRRNRRS